MINNRFYLLILFSGLVSGLLLVFSPAIVGVWISDMRINYAQEISIHDRSIELLVVMLSVFAAFFGGALLATIIKKISIFRLTTAYKER